MLVLAATPPSAWPSQRTGRSTHGEGTNILIDLNKSFEKDHIKIGNKLSDSDSTMSKDPSGITDRAKIHFEKY